MGGVTGFTVDRAQATADGLSVPVSPTGRAHPRSETQADGSEPPGDHLACSRFQADDGTVEQEEEDHSPLFTPGGPSPPLNAHPPHSTFAPSSPSLVSSASLVGTPSLVGSPSLVGRPAPALSSDGARLRPSLLSGSAPVHSLDGTPQRASLVIGGPSPPSPSLLGAQPNGASHKSRASSVPSPALGSKEEGARRPSSSGERGGQGSRTPLFPQGGNGDRGSGHLSAGRVAGHRSRDPSHAQVGRTGAAEGAPSGVPGAHRRGSTGPGGRGSSGPRQASVGPLARGRGGNRGRGGGAAGASAGAPGGNLGSRGVPAVRPPSKRRTVVLDAMRLDALDGNERGEPLVLETTDVGNIARFIKRL